ncbi:MAG: hypothetical protein H0W44_01405 [Gammaproteobacteria bacterium]|nr:hypothetical protein [Gammaproteobacteria bacterium]
MKTLLKSQQGISIIMVIFILVALSVLGLSVARMSVSQSMSSAYAVQRTQAYFAARAGADYAMSRIVANAGCAGITTSMVIENYTVTIACSADGTFDEGILADAYTVFNITATASSGAFAVPNAVNRQVRVSIKNP